MSLRTQAILDDLREMMSEEEFVEAGPSSPERDALVVLLKDCFQAAADLVLGRDECGDETAWVGVLDRRSYEASHYSMIPYRHRIEDNDALDEETKTLQLQERLEFIQRNFNVAVGDMEREQRMIQCDQHESVAAARKIDTALYDLVYNGVLSEILCKDAKELEDLSHNGQQAYRALRNTSKGAPPFHEEAG